MMGARMASPLPPETRCVLQLAATGLATSEIAERLGLPVEVVRSRLATAIAALGARSKLEAVILALRRGLIQLPND
jgi:DNA-binding NarL/FixJ family response regulator